MHSSASLFNSLSPSLALASYKYFDVCCGAGMSFVHAQTLRKFEGEIPRESERPRTVVET